MCKIRFNVTRYIHVMLAVAKISVHLPSNTHQVFIFLIVIIYWHLISKLETDTVWYQSVSSFLVIFTADLVKLGFVYLASPLDPDGIRPVPMLAFSPCCIFRFIYSVVFYSEIIYLAVSLSSVNK